MPRLDKTFKDTDLIRFFCKNLDPTEKSIVLNIFRQHVLAGKPICPNEDEGTDLNLCQWAAYLESAVNKAQIAGNVLQRILALLAAIETALTPLSLLGPIGRIVAAIRALIAYTIEVLIPITAIFIMIGELKPFASLLREVICQGAAPYYLPEPPAIDPEINEPVPPDNLQQELIDAVHEYG